MMAQIYVYTFNVQTTVPKIFHSFPTFIKNKSFTKSFQVK